MTGVSGLAKKIPPEFWHFFWYFLIAQYFLIIDTGIRLCVYVCKECEPMEGKDVWL